MPVRSLLSRRHLFALRFHVRNVAHRQLATVAGNDPSKLRNMALVAHIDSGKTTLTESILLKSSYLSSAGTVDTGSTTTDFMPAERERGITIQSASIPVKWRDWTFNLIDTPGHADFGMEVESASRVVDGAVVLLDSVEGVEAQTRGVWKQLDRYGVRSRLMFLNKLDRAGASFSNSVRSILANRLHPKPMVLSLPVASFNPEDYSRAEPGVQGLVDLVKWEVWTWDENGESTRHPLPQNLDELDRTSILSPSHPLVPHLLPARTALLENLSMFSEDLMETLLGLPSIPSAYLNVGASTILPHLRNATIRNEILPILCGSAFKHIGTELVMDYVGELFPSPADIVDTVPTAKAPLRMLAWKVSWDKRRGWMTFVRVYSGTLTRQSSILNATRNQKEKVSKLLLLYASQAEEVESLSFGDVGVILGLRYTRTGDTLVSTQQPSGTSSLRDIIPPPAVMSASVIPQSHSDLGPLQNALESLARTDPSVRVETQEGQILVHGLGSLHLEIVESRLRDEWNAQFETGKRRVSYREALGSGHATPLDNTWTTEIAGKSIPVTIDFAVKPLEDYEQGDPLWDGNKVIDANGKPLLSLEAYADQKDPAANIASGISNALSNSPHTSLALSHLHIQVKSYRYPQEAAPSSVLAGAAASLLRECIRNAGMGPLMEPYIRLKITINEESVGKVAKDLTEHGGEVLDLATGSGSAIDAEEEMEPYSEDGVYVPPKELSPSSANTPENDSSSAQYKRSIFALAPLSRMLDYSDRLRALSGGNGTFEMVNAGFRQVSVTRKVEILREIGRA
ncbi:P-loop containing nucleoside triphosphate hydrolase protein [Laetiporus sulphureus 93-53]|uniref:p-loop containing nucleoside triphosphate hydrolase protein n=1 Tax=Laetiporus sulphureus 93-53 TaxID=1314785 RepID=A0A165I2Q9_9APHY|nr:P-loop containing nucleoside triphosphate hydrolase protein [Laetiporus sulphureus 93-53]KZT12513.1 P-loop containing nucleoside triphosphate hydrolase protein [Laetiporus sulphureus 93-53]